MANGFGASPFERLKGPSAVAGLLDGILRAKMSRRGRKREEQESGLRERELRLREQRAGQQEQLPLYLLISSVT